MGGVRSGASFRANVEALDKVKLKMRVLHGASSPATACEVLGFSLAMPVLVAPMAGAQFNMGGFFSEERFAEIAVAGAREAGIAACTGDGTDEAFQCGLAAVARAGGWGIPVVKPWSGDFFFARMDQAAEAGCRAVGMDIDTAAFTALRSPLTIAIYFPGQTVCASTISTSDVFTIASAAVTPVDVVLNSIIPIALLMFCPPSCPGLAQAMPPAPSGCVPAGVLAAGRAYLPP